MNPPSSPFRSVYPAYLDALLKGERQACRTAVRELLEQRVEIKSLYVELFQRSLYRVGELWEQDRISVAREHLATAITESLLNLVYPELFAAPHCGRKAVVSCVANEYHQLGGRMVADILEVNGWDGYFLGANTPTADLLAMLREKQADLLCLSLSVYFNLPRLLDALNQVEAAFPKLPIFVGGQAFQWGGADLLARYRNVRLTRTLHEVETLVQEWPA